ncbi:MAG TPA: M48 family metalloprotease [Burkholderiales bacterium]|nr:M48 family metalloprotease [Burkholderiales bacterium]
MKGLLAAILLALPGLAAGQRVLEFRNDFAFSAAEVNDLAARAYGARLRTLARAGKLDPEPALKARLQRIAPRLIRAADHERPGAARLQWEIHACRQCDENASAMAGGKLLLSAEFVHRLALSDDELAYLLAHEMAHVLAQHTREFASAARYFADNGLRRDYADLRHELSESIPLMLSMNQLSVQQELEADYIGFVLGAEAGFRPQAMLSLLAKLGDSSDSIFATHPSAAQRMQQARTMLESARRLYAEARARGLK